MDCGERRSFEFGEWILKHGSTKLRVIVIYRILYSAAHPVSTSVFFDEFPAHLESVVMSPEPLLITGDFNIHVDVPNDSDAARFLELLTSMGLEQHIDKPTHISGHTLDLIVTRCSDSLLFAKPIADYLFSDHITVLCDLELGKPPPQTKCPTGKSRILTDKSYRLIYCFPSSAKTLRIRLMNLLTAITRP